MSDAGGLCISCLEAGNVFNIFDVHECEGIEEIYADMLKTCFYLSITKNAAINHMCENCILNLRQAYYFKKNIVKNIKVLDSKSSAHIEIEHLEGSEQNSLEQILDPETGQMKIILKDNDDRTKTLVEYKNYTVLNQSTDNETTLQEKSKGDAKKKRTTKRRKIKDDENTTENVCEDGSKSAEALSEIAQYQCGHCKKQFDGKQAIARHIKTHLKGPFECHICNRVFTKLNSRNSHIWRVHQTESPYVCAHCGARFATFHKRLAHLKTAHGMQTEYPCPYCDNMYYYAGARSEHVRATHLRARGHACALCRLAFHKRRELAAHMATRHDIGEKKFMCPICGKRFFRNTVLKYHMKRHTENVGPEKKYECSLCSAKFTYKAVLRNHMKCHELDISPIPQQTRNDVADIIILSEVLEQTSGTINYVIE